MKGTNSDPYDNLFDAIERAYELAADSSLASITILLLEGTHFLNRQVRAFSYRATKIDKNS